MLCLCLLFLPPKLMLVWLVSVLTHELSHYLSILITGGKIHNIQIGLSGFKMQTSSMSHWQELFCAASGPVGGLMLFIIFMKKLPLLAVFALIHSLYNLIPLYPLDGGRVLHSVIGLLCSEGHFNRVTSNMDACVSIILVLVAVCLILRFMSGPLPLILVLVMIFNNKRLKCS